MSIPTRVWASVLRRPALVALLCALSLASPALLAARGGGQGGGEGSPPMASPGGGQGYAPGRGSGGGYGNAPGYGPGHGAGYGAGYGAGHGYGYAPGWRWDGAYGHGHYYPAIGWGVGYLPAYAALLAWGGITYGYYGGVWYQPGGYGYVVTMPPVGIVVGELPVYRTVVTVDGLGYYYANGVYYRERAEGGYAVVDPPVAPGGVAAAAPMARLFVYPRNAQSATQQASDEYECHRWAVAQSAFDPSAQATGQSGNATTGRDDYQRARAACLEGRGYTVR